MARILGKQTMCRLFVFSKKLGRTTCLPFQVQLKKRQVAPDPFFFISIKFFKKNLIIFILISLVFFILFRKPLLNDDDFLVMCLMFEDVFLIYL
jgi:hypothetical protein